MRRKEFALVKELDINSLKTKVVDLRRVVQNLVLDKATNKLKDKKMIFKKRKELAQILTVLKQKQLLGELELKVKGET